MSIAECRRVLPMPLLWVKLGISSPGPDAGKSRQQMVCAPWRSEKTPSVAVTRQGEAWMFYDHGAKFGGDEVKVIELMCGVEQKEAFRIYHEMAGVTDEKPAAASRGGRWGELVAVYDYLDAAGRLVHQTLRYEPGRNGAKKDFAQRRPAEQGMTAGTKEAKVDRATGRWWLWTLEGIEPVLYRLPDLLAREREVVWIVEGEKDADVLRAEGVLATTCAMGSKKWRASYSEVLALREVVICGDSDGPGREHGRQVGRELKKVGCKVRWVRWESVFAEAGLDASKKWDAAKHIAGI